MSWPFGMSPPLGRPSFVRGGQRKHRTDTASPSLAARAQRRGHALTPYPAARYQMVREGRMSTREYIDDLIEHVKADMARRDRTAH